MISYLKFKIRKTQSAVALFRNIVGAGLCWPNPVVAHLTELTKGPFNASTEFNSKFIEINSIKLNQSVLNFFKYSKFVFQIMNSLDVK